VREGGVQDWVKYRRSQTGKKESTSKESTARKRKILGEDEAVATSGKEKFSARLKKSLYTRGGSASNQREKRLGQVTQSMKKRRGGEEGCRQN